MFLLRILGVLSFAVVSAKTTGLVRLPRDAEPPQPSQVSPRKFAESLIPESYSALEPPPTVRGAPTKIEFSVIVMNVRDVEEVKQQITLEMNLRVYWVDTRLENLTGVDDFIVINPASFENRLWRPDVFIDRAKNVHQPILFTKPASMRLFFDGGIRYSARIQLDLSCQMDFFLYPADTQHCDVDIKSYAYPNTILVLSWHGGLQASFAPGLSSISNYFLAIESTGEFLTTSTSGVYSGIRFRVKLKRDMSYHLIQTYLPSTMFIIVSWLTFIMPQDSGAVAIAMTTLLTLTAMFAAVRQITPGVSYAKAIDIWMVVCMFYVFFALAQHIVTMRLRHMKITLKKQKKKNEETQRPSVTNEQNDDPPVEDDRNVLGVSYRGLNTGGNSFQMRNMPDRNENDVNRRYSKEPTYPPPPVPLAEEDAVNAKINEYKFLGNKIRRVFSLFTPLSFLFFNIIYWSWLLGSSEKWM